MDRSLVGARTYVITVFNRNMLHTYYLHFIES